MQLKSLAFLLLACTVAPGAVEAAPAPPELTLRALDGSSRLAERIANGTLDFGHPAVAALRGPAGTVCSAVLVGCRTALAAAHCFCRDADTGEPIPGTTCSTRTDLTAPGPWTLFFQHGGVASLAKIDVSPDFVFGTRSDLAVLHLAGPVEGIAPLPIAADPRPVPGTLATVVGFGRAGGNAVDRGLKRSGRVQLLACSAVPDDRNLCWRFTEPLPAPGLSSNSCDGDAGGPLLLDVAGGTAVGGILSGGVNPSCQPLDESWASDVTTDRTWIASVAGTDLGASTCGGLPAVGAAGATVTGGSGDLSGEGAEARTTLVVPAGTARLRVALHGDEVGRTFAPTDFDLYLRASTAPTTSLFDCRSDDAGVFEQCDLALPAAATWHLLVSRNAGAGAYQLTTTTFAQSASVCTPGEATLCIDDTAADKRFKVQVDYYSTRNGGFAGTGKAIALTELGVTRGGLFWFFDAGNPELLVKVLNGCGINNRYWVYLTAGTDVGYTVTITDTSNGVSKTYRNADGSPALPVQDVDALACH